MASTLIASFEQDNFFGPYLHQSWSFPDSTICYVTKNPSSPTVYQKLVESCKHFYAKNPILILKHFRYHELKWETSAGNLLPLDLAKSICKFWVTDSFRFLAKENDPILNVSIKIYKCGINN